ncbi:hypothetical protein [Otoolea muris]|uniref:hypothetical protein n=1 Tax=Otoolea muris TaxID=2941515 RepID=UPI00203F2735|nr:hypothetical protein [Otoolea muris]
MAHIITLTGPAHCGKSTISQLFMECEDEYFRPIHVAKYTTRPQRKNDEDVICVDEIPEECDLIYEQYGVRYGLKLDTVYELLEKGRTPIIVLNDIRAVEDIKSILGSLAVSIFLYRKEPVYEEFYEEEKERAGERVEDSEIERSAKTRYEKAQAIFRIYIENIPLFDQVILNTYDLGYTKKQVMYIVNQLEQNFGGLKEGDADVH